MRDQLRERLLSSLIAAGRLREDDVDLATAWEQLDAYVELELANQDAETRLPLVAFFIATDPDFARAYADLRATLIALEEHGLPEAPIDMEAMAARLMGQIVIAPEDVVRPLPQPKPTAPQGPEQVVALVQAWERTLTRYSRAHMSAALSADTTFSARIPDLPEIALEMTLATSGEGADIDGRVRPLTPGLVGLPLQLFAITLDPGPVVQVVAEQPIDRFGRFAFSDLPPGHYVLALIVDETLLGVAWIDLD